MVMREKCGIFGIASTHTKASEVIYFGLYGLQHRGQEGAGIGTADAYDGIHVHKAAGTIDWVFKKDIPLEDRVDFIRENCDMPRDDLIEEVAEFEHDSEKRVLEHLPGNVGIGHVRYSTTGASGSKNIHPIRFDFRGTPALIAHNGNLVRLGKLRDVVNGRGGYAYEGSTDTALIAALMATSSKMTFYGALLETLPLLEGAFSLVFLYRGAVYAVKDRFGIRPLCVGKTDDAFVVSSETDALDTIEAEFVKELDPGEGAILRPNAMDYFTWARDAVWKSCIFEGPIYFSRPDSVFRGKSAHEMRRRAGELLAERHPVLNADVVIAVPDSGESAAIGYAAKLSEKTGKFLYDKGMIRPHFVGRTFIMPVEELRHEYQRIKHNPIRSVISGKRVVIVDDSIVRGTTTPYVVYILKELGATEVHLRVASPPLRGACHLGVDIPWPRELIANKSDENGHIVPRTVEEIRQSIADSAEVRLDSLEYLSLNDVKQATGLPEGSFCTGCFDGNYPVLPEDAALYNPKDL